MIATIFAHFKSNVTSLHCSRIVKIRCQLLEKKNYNLSYWGETGIYQQCWGVDNSKGHH